MDKPSIFLHFKWDLKKNSVMVLVAMVFKGAAPQTLQITGDAFICLCGWVNFHLLELFIYFALIILYWQYHKRAWSCHLIQTVLFLSPEGERRIRYKLNYSGDANGNAVALGLQRCPRSLLIQWLGQNWAEKHCPSSEVWRWRQIHRRAAVSCYPQVLMLSQFCSGGLWGVEDSLLCPTRFFPCFAKAVTSPSGPGDLGEAHKTCPLLYSPPILPSQAFELTPFACLLWHWQCLLTK